MYDHASHASTIICSIAYVCAAVNSATTCDRGGSRHGIGEGTLVLLTEKWDGTTAQATRCVSRNPSGFQSRPPPAPL